jgi:hypothetical protein
MGRACKSTRVILLLTECEEYLIGGHATYLVSITDRHCLRWIGDLRKSDVVWLIGHYQSREALKRPMRLIA